MTEILTSQPAHTPGPWEWFGNNLLCGGRNQAEDVLKAEDDRKPYGMHSALIEHHWDAAQAAANRRLIAAAPELLAALIELERNLNSYAGPFAPGEDGATDRARAAIAKATGAQA